VSNTRQNSFVDKLKEKAFLSDEKYKGITKHSCKRLLIEKGENMITQTFKQLNETFETTINNLFHLSKFNISCVNVFILQYLYNYHC